ncbi:hypothetical protein BBO99_00000437 [Phytophthora kernoviae]|uniref:Uncharacterized protein n=1 Tax=Phytophthora kernoviae TaxID=325452 RepID=A0A3R7GMN0_9STRA|nr:hypothetical protein JM16_004192 [Phytophthora kernoviae]RLN20608.1 hypothetical protein BBI17_004512 [Phytophthora kernoviae]RLN85520.1 hypothetical protein BBO99_00000437 [Phytophthora kernoviae]
MRLDFARDRAVLLVSSHGDGGHDLRFWEIGSWDELPPPQMRDAHWGSKRSPSLVSGANETDEMSPSPQNYPTVTADGHAMPVTNWVVTKNEHFLLSAGGADRVICQFRLLPHVGSATGNCGGLGAGLLRADAGLGFEELGARRCLYSKRSMPGET